MRLHTLVATAGLAALVAACGQNETTSPIYPQPTFDKFGGGVCEEGYTYTPGSTSTPTTCIPDDGCIPVFDTAGTQIDCLPPDDFSEERNPGRTGRSPTGAAGVP